MTNQDILLVQLSWRKVLPIKDAAAELFYLKLFELDPQTPAAVAVQRHGDVLAALEAPMQAVREISDPGDVTFASPGSPREERR